MPAPSLPRARSRGLAGHDDAWKHPRTEVTVALVGKYIQLHDAYISVVEALKHAGVAHRARVHIKWVDSERVNRENASEILSGVSGILVPGGFGDRGIDGKIYAIQYARENGIPFLGLCLGMQLAIVEFARDVIGWEDAHSVELNPATTHPVIHLMPEQDGIEDIGGTLRLAPIPAFWTSPPRLSPSTGKRRSTSGTGTATR